MRLFIILTVLVASTYAGSTGYTYEPNKLTSTQTILSPVVGGFKPVADTLEIATVSRPVITSGVVGINKPVITSGVVGINKPVITSGVVGIKPVITSGVVGTNNFVSKSINTAVSPLVGGLQIASVNNPVITSGFVGTNTVISKPINTAVKTIVSPVVGGFKPVADSLEIASVNKPVITSGFVGTNNVISKPINTAVKTIVSPVVGGFKPVADSLEITTVNKPVITSGFVGTNNVISKPMNTAVKTIVSPVVGGFKPVADSLNKPVITSGFVATGNVISKPVNTLVTADVDSVFKPVSAITSKVTVAPTQSSTSAGVTKQMEAFIGRSSPGGIVTSEKLASRFGGFDNLGSTAGGSHDKVAETSEVVANQKAISSDVGAPRSFAFNGGSGDKVAETSKVIETDQLPITTYVEGFKSFRSTGSNVDKVAETSKVVGTQQAAGIGAKEFGGLESTVNLVSSTGSVNSDKILKSNTITGLGPSIVNSDAISTSGKVVPIGSENLAAVNKPIVSNSLSDTGKLISGVFSSGASKPGLSGSSGIVVDVGKTASATEVKDTAAFSKQSSAGNLASDSNIVSRFGELPSAVKTTVNIVKPAVFTSVSSPVVTTGVIGSSKTVLPDVAVRSSTFNLDKLVTASNLGAVGGFDQNLVAGKIIQSPATVNIPGSGVVKSTGTIASVTTSPIVSHQTGLLLGSGGILPGTGTPVSVSSLGGVSVPSSSFTRIASPVLVGTAPSVGLNSGVIGSSQILSSNIQPTLSIIGSSRKQQNSYVGASQRLGSLPLTSISSTGYGVSGGLRSVGNQGLSSLPLAGVSSTGYDVSGGLRSVGSQGLSSVPLTSVSSTGYGVSGGLRSVGSQGLSSLPLAGVSSTGFGVSGGLRSVGSQGLSSVPLTSVSSTGYGVSGGLRSVGSQGLSSLPLAGVSSTGFGVSGGLRSVGSQGLSSVPLTSVSSTGYGVSGGLRSVGSQGLSSLPLTGVSSTGFGVSGGLRSVGSQGLSSLPLTGVSSTGYGISGGLSSGGSLIPSTVSNVGAGLAALDSAPQTVEYNKQIFYFSAPEEQINESEVTYQVKSSLKKNLQVVLINTPENVAATNAALQLAKQAIEQKTSVYVLSKESDTAHIVGQLQEFQKDVSTAPEVSIVKYRTPHDLAHAREEILAKYNNFGGPANQIDGGVVPVLNYASSNAVHSGIVPAVTKVVGGTVPLQQSVYVSKGSGGSYLPPSHL